MSLRASLQGNGIIDRMQKCYKNLISVHYARLYRGWAEAKQFSAFQEYNFRRGMCPLYFRDKTIAPRDLLSPSETLLSRVKLLRSAAYSYPPAPPFLTVYPHSAGISLEIK